MTDEETSSVGEPPPQYMIFLLVFFFFLTGLLGFLICHMLKKKGYRCRTGDLDDEQECEDKVAPANNEDGSEDNQDTVEQILKCIIENEANMEAFKEMLVTQNACEHNDASKFQRKESLGGIPPHLHTVHSGADRNSCHLCAQGRSKKARRRSRVPRSKARPGEQTVFSVGRFRVTHMEKKGSLQGSTNLPVNEPGDQSDLTEPLDEREDAGTQPEGYNLRNMFKDVSPTNGAVPAEARPKKSVTLLPLRRSSDPAVTKKTRPPAPVVVDAAVVVDDNDNHPDSSEPPESPVPPPEEGTDTDVPTDSEMAPDKAPPVAAATEAEPQRMREFSVVRMGEPGTPGEDGRDDMVEMEDIKDCRVSQEEDGRHTREEKRRSVHAQHKW